MKLENMDLSKLTKENLSAQFCSDSLKEQIANLLDENEKLRKAVNYAENQFLSEIFNSENNYDRTEHWRECLRSMENIRESKP